MKKQYKKLILVAIIFFIFNFFITNTYAMTSSYNSDYEYKEVNGNVNSMLSVVTDLVLPTIYPIVSVIVTMSEKAMYVFTGQYTFPWSDSIIFNRITFLDVNFINPEPGSLFMNVSNQYTVIGNVVRNIYFTILSICIGFLGIAVAINVIKMLLATIPSSRARYKEMINATIMTLVLLFMLHYLISFIFYLNEQLVEVASTMSQKILGGGITATAIDNLYKAEEANNDKILENFFDKCNHTSWWSPVTIVKKVVKELVNVGAKIVDWISGLGDAIKDAWDKLWGNNSDDGMLTVSKEDKRKKDKNGKGYYGEIFPSKDDFIGYFDKEDMVGKNGKAIAVFLLKDYIYRDYMLSTVAGNDTNSFWNAGPLGWMQSISNTVFWFTGIVDTGLLGLQNLYNSTTYIYNNLANDQNLSKAGYDLSSAAAISETINKLQVLENNQTNDDIIASIHILTLYIKAYYRYVYDGSDKDVQLQNTSMIQNLGEYFRRNRHQIDVESKEWSGSKFDAINAILYCALVVQSFMFLVSYIKRLLYTTILAVIGPATVVYDYIMKSY